MAFMTPEERYFLMNISYVCQGEVPSDLGVDVLGEPVYSVDDIKRLGEVGIKTQLVMHSMWNQAEQTKGVYDWSVYDGEIERAEAAGIKTMFYTATHYPKWFPDDWYVKTAEGVGKGALSPWNKEAMDYNNEYTQMLIDRYASPTVLIVNSQLRCGETVLFNEPAFYNDHAIENYRSIFGAESFPEPHSPDTHFWLKQTYIEMLLAQAKILIQQEHQELWCMLHPAIANFGLYIGNGNSWIPEILEAYRNEINPKTMNQLFFTWIQWGLYWGKMQEWGVKYGTKLYGGAEYSEGIVTTTPAAIAMGLSGQIIAPCYPGVHDKLEDWMLKNIYYGMSLWNEYGKNN